MKPVTRVVKVNSSEYNELLDSGWIEWDNDGRSAIMVLDYTTAVS